MAYVRKYKKVYPKKKTTRRRKTYAKRSNYLLPKNPQYTVGGVVKKTHVVNLCYRQTLTLESLLLGLSGTYQFRLNSIYDPDYTSILTGHQPLGHDQWNNFYKTYRVLGAKITCKFFWDTSSTVGQAHRVGIVFDKDTTIESNANTMLEKMHGKCSKILKGNSRDSQTVTCYYSGKKFFGKEFLDHQHESPFGSNPVLPCLATIYASAIDADASTSPVRCEVMIDYITLFADPVDLSAS